MKNRKHVILCVDDDQDFLDSIKAIVENGGYTIEAAGNVKEGLTKYKESKPDIVLVDLMMEDIDSGISIVKEIRALDVTLPVYVLSSIGDNLQNSTDYAELGLTGILQKPIKPDILLSILKAKLNK